jgi:hypothetical protein
MVIGCSEIDEDRFLSVRFVVVSVDVISGAHMIINEAKEKSKRFFVWNVND